MKKITIQLTEKELYLVWSVVCWFDKPFTNVLKAKLSGMSRDPKRKLLEKEYDKQIIQRIVEIGDFLTRNHPEWIKD